MVVPDKLFGLVPLWVGVWLLGVLGFGAAGVALWQRFALPVLQGRRDERRFDRPLERLWGMLLVVFGQRRVLMSVSFRWRDLAGLGHFVIFWSFCSMAFAYALFIFLDSMRPWVSGYVLSPGGLTFFFWWLDILATVGLAALAWAAFRRWIGRPARLRGLRSWEAALILLAIGVILALGGAAEVMHAAAYYRGQEIGRQVTHLAGTHLEQASASTPVAGNIGRVLADGGLSFGIANTLHGLFFWLHYLAILALGVYIAYSKHMHIVASPLNALFRSLKPRGALIPIPNIAEATTWGAKRPHEFTWKELLDGYACAVCGRCTEACPANGTGKPLSPMDLVGRIKDNLLEVTPAIRAVKDPQAREQIADQRPLFNQQFTEEWVWNCVTCGACEQECPVLVEHIDSIVDMRRYLVMSEAKMPAQVEQTLRGLETRGHPWRGSQGTRLDWTKGLNVKVMAECAQQGEPIDVLFWVGCTPALEQRSQSTARAMARVMERAGVSFAVLGPEETCNGDPARRLGSEYLFDILARKNLDVLRRYQVKTIVTTCPHCFNTLKNEYPDFGGAFQVEHYATFVKRLVDEGRLKLGRRIDTVMTYHDSCYLGRHNGIYDEPRDLARAIPGLQVREVPRHTRERGFCCGAGGGHMWLEETSGKRINHARTDQVLTTGSQAVGVSCPFCLQMFKEGLEAARRPEVKAVDLIELVAEAME